MTMAVPVPMRGIPLAGVVRPCLAVVLRLCLAWLPPMSTWPTLDHTTSNPTTVRRRTTCPCTGTLLILLNVAFDLLCISAICRWVMAPTSTTPTYGPTRPFLGLEVGISSIGISVVLQLYQLFCIRILCCFLLLVLQPNFIIAVLYKIHHDWLVTGPTRTVLVLVIVTTASSHSSAIACIHFVSVHRGDLARCSFLLHPCVHSVGCSSDAWLTRLQCFQVPGTDVSRQALAFPQR